MFVQCLQRGRSNLSSGFRQTRKNVRWQWVLDFGPQNENSMYSEKKSFERNMFGVFLGHPQALDLDLTKWLFQTWASSWHRPGSFWPPSNQTCKLIAWTWSHGLLYSTRSFKKVVLYIPPTCRTLAKIRPKVELVATGDVMLHSTRLSDNNTAGLPAEKEWKKSIYGRSDYNVPTCNIKSLKFMLAFNGGCNLGMWSKKVLIQDTVAITSQSAFNNGIVLLAAGKTSHKSPAIWCDLMSSWGRMWGKRRPKISTKNVSPGHMSEDWVVGHQFWIYSIHLNKMNCLKRQLCGLSFRTCPNNSCNPTLQIWTHMKEQAATSHLPTFTTSGLVARNFGSSHLSLSMSESNFNSKRGTQSATLFFSRAPAMPTLG